MARPRAFPSRQALSHADSQGAALWASPLQKKPAMPCPVGKYFVPSVGWAWAWAHGTLHRFCRSNDRARRAAAGPRRQPQAAQVGSLCCKASPRSRLWSCWLLTAFPAPAGLCCSSQAVKSRGSRACCPPQAATCRLEHLLAATWLGTAVGTVAWPGTTLAEPNPLPGWL